MSAPWTGGTDPGSNRPSVDGNYTFAAPVGQPHISFPFDHDSRAPLVKSFFFDPQEGFYADFAPDPTQNNLRTDCFLIEQEFEIAGDYFSGLALDSFYDQADYAPAYSGGLPLSEAILVGESNPVERGNGVVRWTRTYCRMPGILNDGGYFSRNDYETLPFTFPAIAPTSVFQLSNAALAALGIIEYQGDFGDNRTTRSLIITARVEQTYFLAPAGSFSPNTFDPTLPSFQFDQFVVYGVTGWNIVDQVADPEFYAAGKFTDLNNNPVGAPFDDTAPPKTDQGPEHGYLTAIDQGWEICVRASEIKQWRGNIFCRTTWWSAAQ